MAAMGRVLLVGFARASAPIRTDLLQLGLLPLEVDDLAAAAREFERGTRLRGIVFLSASTPEHGLRRAIEQLQRASKDEARVIAVGAPPHLHTRRLLRECAIAVGLWTPYAFEDLRLAIDIASPRRDVERRSFRRIPTQLYAELIDGERRAAAEIRDLSVSGARIETALDLTPRAEVAVRFELAGSLIDLAAVVACAVEAASAEDERRGFGARFVAPPSAALTQLAAYVNGRIDAQRV